MSCWLAPYPLSKPESWYSWSQSWLLWFRQGLNNLRHGGRGGLNIRRYYLWKERQAECQKAIWDDERGYYFCNIVAVRPDAQGRGVGRKLFEEVTKIADREGMKCYLESSRFEPNVGIYQRLGFQLRMEMECRDGDGDGEACKVCAPLLDTSAMADCCSFIVWCVSRTIHHREQPGAMPLSPVYRIKPQHQLASLRQGDKVCEVLLNALIIHNSRRVVGIDRCHYQLNFCILSAHNYQDKEDKKQY